MHSLNEQPNETDSSWTLSVEKTVFNMIQHHRQLVQDLVVIIVNNVNVAINTYSFDSFNVETTSSKIRRYEHINLAILELL